MTATTHAEFGEKTGGLEVAKAFPGQVQGRTILITGVNRQGIGYSTAQAFASQSPTHLILAGRTPTKLQQCIDELKSEYPNVDYRPLKLDLSSQKAVRSAAAELLAWSDIPAIDIVVNSAGVGFMAQRELSEDGLEMHLATNHIGHFLFTCLIMPKILKAAEVRPKGATRVVNVTSLSPTWARMRWSDINFEKVNNTLPASEQPPYEVLKQWGTEKPEEKSYVPIEGYNQSKVANVLFGIALSKRLFDKYGVLSVAVHPGVIGTELGRYASDETMAAIEKFKGMIYYKTLDGGAATSVVAALDPKLGLPVSQTGGPENHGAYFIDCQISDQATPEASSSSEAEKLWKLSEDLVKEKFAW